MQVFSVEQKLQVNSSHVTDNNCFTSNFKATHNEFFSDKVRVMSAAIEDEKAAFERLRKSRKLGLCQKLSNSHRETYLEGQTPADRFVSLFASERHFMNCIRFNSKGIRKHTTHNGLFPLSTLQLLKWYRYRTHGLTADIVFVGNINHSGFQLSRVNVFTIYSNTVYV